MVDNVERLKTEYRVILGDKPSAMFMSKVEKMLDEGRNSPETLRDSCRRTESMVKIFIDVELAKTIGTRWRELLGEA